MHKCSPFSIPHPSSKRANTYASKLYTPIAQTGGHFLRARAGWRGFPTESPRWDWADVEISGITRSVGRLRLRIIGTIIRVHIALAMSDIGA
jgi:hypothetical protein